MTNVVALKTPDVPDFIDRHDLTKMSDDEIEALVIAIRTRRMKSFVVYQETKKEKAAIKGEKLVTRIEAKCEQFIKKLATIDKQLEALEKYANEIRGMRIEAGLNPMI